MGRPWLVAGIVHTMPGPQARTWAGERRRRWQSSGACCVCPAAQQCTVQNRHQRSRPVQHVSHPDALPSLPRAQPALPGTQAAARAAQAGLQRAQAARRPLQSQLEMRSQAPGPGSSVSSSSPPQHSTGLSCVSCRPSRHLPQPRRWPQPLTTTRSLPGQPGACMQPCTWAQTRSSARS